MYPNNTQCARIIPYKGRVISLKFFTKEWYNNMQRLGRARSKEEQIRLNLELGIEKAMNDYRRHIKRNGMEEWDDELSFHDAIIMKAEFDGNDFCIRLIWEEQNIWDGHYTEIQCKNATIIKQECDIAKRRCRWLYEEVHPAQNDYELHCMFVEYETGNLLELIVAFQDMLFINKWD